MSDRPAPTPARHARPRTMHAARAIGRRLRPWLDRLYDLCGGLAALFLIVLLLIIVAQMAARWSGQQFPGSTDYAGYCMAAASFLALAHTLNRGAHIRVALLLTRLGRWRRLASCGASASAPRSAATSRSMPSRRCGCPTS
jgi:Tripartite ATP-independent periplasmic transporters, DctQ component